MTGLAVSVFVASLFGSLHCAAMCGGLAGFYSAGSRDGGWRLARAHLAYHATRLVAYASLGGAAGAAGRAIDLVGARAGVASLAAAIAGAVMLAWGAALLSGASPSPLRRLGLPRALDVAFQRAAEAMRRKPPTARAILLGLASALLPCGWLYAFVLVAAGTGRAFDGLVLMSAFWLGTVPALVGVSFGARALAVRLGRRLPVATALSMMVIGIVAVVTRIRMPIDPAHFDSHESVPSDSMCHGQ